MNGPQGKSLLASLFILCINITPSQIAILEQFGNVCVFGHVNSDKYFYFQGHFVVQQHFVITHLELICNEIIDFDDFYLNKNFVVPNIRRLI